MKHKLRVGQIVTIHPNLGNMRGLPYGTNGYMVALAGERFKITRLGRDDRVYLDAPREVTEYHWAQEMFLEYYYPNIDDVDFIIESVPELLSIKTE